MPAYVCRFGLLPRSVLKLITPTLALFLAQSSAETATHCNLPSGILPALTRAVIILDTSGSMQGLGDGKANIFLQVKSAVSAYVVTNKPNHLDLITFDNGIRSNKSYDLPDDQLRFEKDLKELQANGRNTHLYSSMQGALAPLKDKERYVTNVFVLTDGIDNNRNHSVSAKKAISSFGGRGELDSLTYIALGTEIPPEAKQALTESDYASGIELPVGKAPDLLAGGIGTQSVTATDPNNIPTPYPDLTPVTLASAREGLALKSATTNGSAVSVQAPANLPYSTPALLCAPPSSGKGLIGARPRRILLTLNFGKEGAGMRWLNPGANRSIKQGEEVVLRYFASPSLNLSSGQVSVATSSSAPVKTEIIHLPNSRFFSVKIRNTGSDSGQILTPRLVLSSGRSVDLASISLGSGIAPAITNITSMPSSQNNKTGNWAWLVLLVAAGLALAGLTGYWLMLKKDRKPRPLKAAPEEAPYTVSGINYSEERHISLVSDKGEVSALTTPLGGAFDLGQAGKIPLLSGVRLEQDLDGLRLLRLPDDLEISQGARLLDRGDLIRPGTLLGVTVAKPARAPHAPLGSLIGLGLPLSLQPDGVTLNLIGPYGTHSITLNAGINDLGDEFSAAALRGLRFSTSGAKILIVSVPKNLLLTRPGETDSMKAGTYLPEQSILSIPAEQ